MPPVIVVAEPGFKHRKFLNWMFTGSDVMSRKQKCGLLQRVAPLRARLSPSGVLRGQKYPDAGSVCCSGGWVVLFVQWRFGSLRVFANPLLENRNIS